MMDVAIVAGSGVREWPTVGAITLSRVCSQFGLQCGFYGGTSGVFRGFIPRVQSGVSDSGGWIIFQDSQGRIHEVAAKSVVRMVAKSELPDPFSGWDSLGWVPLSTAEKLLRESGVQFQPRIAIYGATPRSIKFANLLLTSHRTQVVLIPTPEQLQVPQIWGVDFYRFLMLGGVWHEGLEPLSQARLEQKSPLLWSFKLGPLEAEISHLIVAGPFYPKKRQEPFSGQGTAAGIHSWDILEREYPQGSLRFEMECVSLPSGTISKSDKYTDPYLLLRVQEEEVARSIALKIVRALKRDLGEHREEFEQLQKTNQVRRKKWNRFKAHPFRYGFSGKLLDKNSLSQVKRFEGVPKRLHELKPMVSIECIESIGCQICQEACPTDAIQISRTQNLFLEESKCTACGFCLQVCPSQVPILMHAPPQAPTAKLTLADPSESAKRIEPRETVEVLNRKGEYLGLARVTQVDQPVPSDGIFPRLLTVEVPQHLLWDVRALRSSSHLKRIQEESLADVPQNRTKDFLQSRFEIFLDGEKRWVREKISISVALFELGKARPGDRLLCDSGNCGLCTLIVDGQKQLACKTKVRRGMLVRRLGTEEQLDLKLPIGLATPAAKDLSPFCLCQRVSVGEVETAIEKGQMVGIASAKNLFGIGEGRCHGFYCSEILRRRCGALRESDQNFVSWEFPESDWQLG